MGIDPLDPLSLQQIKHYVDKRNAKLAAAKLVKIRQENKNKPRPFRALVKPRGSTYFTKDNSMVIQGFTLRKLAIAMDIHYQTLKGYVNRKIIPKPIIDVYMKDKEGINKPVSIYTIDESVIISNFVYDYFFQRKLTIDDYLEYKENFNGRNI